MKNHLYIIGLVLSTITLVAAGCLESQTIYVIESRIQYQDLTYSDFRNQTLINELKTMNISTADDTHGHYGFFSYQSDNNTINIFYIFTSVRNKPEIVLTLDSEERVYTDEDGWEAKLTDQKMRLEEPTQWFINTFKNITGKEPVSQEFKRYDVGGIL